MRGLIGGILTGGLVSAVGLGVASVVTELPAGTEPPAAPLIDAPMVDPVSDPATDASRPTATVNSPVGSMSIDEPLAPALPAGEAGSIEPVEPQEAAPEATAPRADTDPLDEPGVLGIEGALEAPLTGETNITMVQPVDPVLPSPQAMAPTTPDIEADLTVSTTPALPVVVVEPQTADPDDGADNDNVMVDGAPQDSFVVDLAAAPETAMTDAPDAADAQVDTDTANANDPAQGPAAATQADQNPVEDAPMDQPTDEILASGGTPDAPRLQLQGGDNALLGDRDTGVTVRRLTDETPGDVLADADAGGVNALMHYSTESADSEGKPLLSIILIDDGSMSAAAAALSGLPFPVTIALDPGLDGVSELMQNYRNDGFEVAVMAKLPEGAQPSDVEVNFQSVFTTLPETIAVLDIGSGGLQLDPAVTAQAMDILAEQGRGFVTVSQGLNMASRAAETAGVPAAVVYRDLDGEDQDARVVRRFVDQAAFRARQESGVVLVGRVRPDTISALILWGTANRDEQVAIVPLSAVLLAQ